MMCGSSWLMPRRRLPMPSGCVTSLRLLWRAGGMAKMTKK
jgi:hypothetical protein